MDAASQQLVFVQLGMGGGSRVDDQRLHIRHIGQQGEQLQRFREPLGLFLGAFQLKSEDGAGPVGEVSIIELLLMPAGQGGMVDLRHLGVMVQIIHHL